jgi:hypothetical protein
MLLAWRNLKKTQFYKSFNFYFYFFGGIEEGELNWEKMDDFKTK